MTRKTSTLAAALFWLAGSAVVAKPPKKPDAEPQSQPQIERLVLQAVGSLGPSAAESSPAKRRCRVRVSSLQSRSSRRFSASAILDLDFNVTLGRGAEGDGRVRLEIETPDGHLFQTLTVPFGEPNGPAAAGRSVEGFPQPLAIQEPRPVTRKRGRPHREIAGRLPVAGTPIVHSSLYGKWTARAFFDDDLEACGHARVFVLEP